LTKLALHPPQCWRSTDLRCPLNINSTVSALRFFFDVTLDRADLAKQASFV
jgi:hypothetical protein